VSGNTQFQRMVGMGVNANSNAWENGALQPALDAMVDTVGTSMWRVIVESHLNWETTNDNSDPNTFNTAYYNALYETPKFQSLWSVLGYLKARNAPIILLNVMGEVPPWMGRSVINASAEDEWVEMITSMLVYARNTKGLRIDYLSPMNEQDLGSPEGPSVNATQYVRLMNKLRVRMDTLGLGDIRFYGAETAYIDRGVNDYLPAILADANLMSRVAGFALHNYGGSSGGAAARIQGSAYPDRPFVMTEFSAGCAGCDNGAPQPTDYEFARNSGLYLMNHLSDGAGGALIYDAYDSFYEHHGAIGYWGLMGKNNGSYFARKRMYVMAQFFKYIRPGAVRVAVSSQVSGVNALAFTGGGNSLATVVGYNSNQGSSADVTLRFDNVAGVKNVQLIQTTPSKDLVASASVPLVGGQVTLRVDGESFFTVLALP
jgi:O-glycosyl hydrolase